MLLQRVVGERGDVKIGRCQGYSLGQNPTMGALAKRDEAMPRINTDDGVQRYCEENRIGRSGPVPTAVLRPWQETSLLAEKKQLPATR